MNNVLDISQFTKERGFVSSSSDDEESIGNNSGRAVSSNLARIFGNESQKKPEAVLQDSATSSLNTTPSSKGNYSLYSAVIDLFILENNVHVHKGKCGLAIIKQNNNIFLIVYNAAKQKLVHFILQKDYLSLTVKDLYVNISSSTISCSLFFKEFLALQDVCAMIMYYCNIPKLIVKEGDGDKCSLNVLIKYSIRTINFADHVPKIEPSSSITTAKISEDAEDYIKNAEGMQKGEILILSISPSHVIIFELLKWKNQTKTENETQRNEVDCLEVPNVILDADTDTIPQETKNSEAPDFESSSEGSSIKSRMARLGQPIFPMANLNQENISSNNTYDTVNENKDPVPTQRTMISEDQNTLTSSVTPNLKCSTVEDYSIMHRVVGIEMDRLEIRLQSLMQSILDKALEPIKNDIAHLKEQQNQIVEQLQDIQKKTNSTQ